MRRNYHTAKPGQVYASEWPEWHVDCASEGCREHTLVAGLGEAYTIAEAEKSARTNRECAGWHKIKGLWYCPCHARKDLAAALAD